MTKNTALKSLSWLLQWLNWMFLCPEEFLPMTTDYKGENDYPEFDDSGDDLEFYSRPMTQEEWQEMLSKEAEGTVDEIIECLQIAGIKRFRRRDGIEFEITEKGGINFTLNPANIA